MAGKAINQYNEFTGNANAVNVLVQETSQSDPNTYEHKKANLATLIKSVASVDDYVEGYYYNGAFYEDSAHTTAIVPTTGRLYGDLTTGTDLYRWSGSEYVQLTPDLSPYATKAEVEEDITDVKNAIQGNSQRIENLEVAVSGSLVQTNVLTDPPSMANVRTITSANTILPWALLNRVGARAVAWNQLFGNVRNSGVYNGVTFTKVDNHTFTISGTAEARISLLSGDGATAVYGHKYLIRGTESNNQNVGLIANGYNGSSYVKTFSGRDTGSGLIVEVDNANVNKFYIEIVIENGTALSKTYTVVPQVFDLTTMNEASLTADQFRAKFPASYYPYNAGQIIPLNPSGFKVVGKNKLNDSVMDDGYIGSDGIQISGSNHKCSHYFSKCTPSTRYYVTIPTGYTGATPTICWYDIDKNFIVRSDFSGFPTFDSPANAFYMKITLFNYGATFNHDIMICLNSVTDKTYEAYKETTIDTSFTSDYKYVNESCHDYSENVLVDGQKMREEHRVVGSHTFTANDTWGYAGGVFNFNIPTMKKGGAIISDAPYTKQQVVYTSLSDKCMASSTTEYSAVNPYFLIRDDSLSGSTSAIASAMVGKTIYFELATPTTTLHNDPIPNFPCEDGTTITAITPQTELVNAIDVPSTIAYMTKISS